VLLKKEIEKNRSGLQNFSNLPHRKKEKVTKEKSACFVSKLTFRLVDFLDALFLAVSPCGCGCD